MGNTCCKTGASGDNERVIPTEKEPMSVSESGGSPLSAQKNPTSDDEAKERAKMDAVKGNKRRSAVSAEAVSRERLEQWKRPIYEKTAAQAAKIRGIIDNNEKTQVLFGHLTDEATTYVVEAFYEKEVGVGKEIIRQGDEGDAFYIVDEGEFDVYVKRGDKEAQKVLSVTSGSCFGELALMYNAPRAATVKATKPGKVWALDRDSFQMMLVTGENTKKKEYEGFLEKVDILHELNKYELSQLSDMLQSDLYDEGEVIIEQGDAGDRFYILEDGECRAYIHGEEGEKEVKVYSNPGDYFGEIALLSDAPRKATIKAMGSGCQVLSVAKEDFDRVLGPIADSLRDKAGRYPAYAEFLKARALMG